MLFGAPRPLPTCPACGSTLVRAHCDTSPTCDMVRCDQCKGWGLKSGRLWRLVEAPKQ